jgi:hypothetical protein
MAEFPLWFNMEEYADFLTESKLLFEYNVPLQKQKAENRTKLRQFDRQISIRRNNLRMELMRDAAQAKAKGIQMGLGEGFKQEMLDKFHSKLLEAANPVKSEKRKMRPEVDPSDRERDRKRESRRQEKQAGLKNILIVKNKSLDRIEIIQKSDYDPKTHELIKGKTKKMDKGSVTIEDLKRYSQRSDFRNTKTSIRILGKMAKISEKEQEDQAQEQESGGKGGSQSKETSAPTPPPPPRPRVPADGKEITDIYSTYPDWDHNINVMTAGIPEILNTLSGKEMSPEMQQALTDSRTLGDALNRFMKELLLTFPTANQYKYSLADKPVKTQKQWAALGVVKSMPKATLNAKGATEKDKLGISVKIGQQLRPVEKGEAGFIYTTVLQAIDPRKTANIFGLLMKDLVVELKTSFTKVPTMPVFDGNTNQALAELQRQTWQTETSNNKKQHFISKCRNILEVLLNKNIDFKTAFLNECLTGNIKFGGGEGIANMMFATNKDGSDTKAIPLDLNYMLNLAKTENTDLVLKYGLGQMVDGSPAQAILASIGQINESTLDGINEFEKLTSQIQDPIMFMQTFGITITDVSFKNPINYSEMYYGDSDQTNYITFNPGGPEEQEVGISVQPNITQTGDSENFLERGVDELFESYILINDLLIEEINQGSLDLLDGLIILENQFNLFEKRNYRKEYDNYHSKPEQRKNRSKRVMARRKMMKKGKVKKGDGKDVDHKDGNPKNNSDSNLRVLSKSKNRSMNEDHGAGFEGTPELLDRLIKDTPQMVNPNPDNRKSIKYIETKLLKNKKK